jgi:hypothetical protein
MKALRRGQNVKRFVGQCHDKLFEKIIKNVFLLTRRSLTFTETSRAQIQRPWRQVTRRKTRDEVQVKTNLGHLRGKCCHCFPPSPQFHFMKYEDLYTNGAKSHFSYFLDWPFNFFLKTFSFSSFFSNYYWGYRITFCLTGKLAESLSRCNACTQRILLGSYLQFMESSTATARNGWQITLQKSISSVTAWIVSCFRILLHISLPFHLIITWEISRSRDRTMKKGLRLLLYHIFTFFCQIFWWVV